MCALSARRSYRSSRESSCGSSIYNYFYRSEKAVDRNGQPLFRTNQPVKGETASRRAEGTPLTD